MPKSKQPKHSTTAAPAPDPATPPAAIPWLWLALAVAAGGVVGWAAANANSFRSTAQTTPSVAPAAPAATTPTPLLPPAAVAGLTAAQSNSIFKMTNPVAAAAGPTPPALLSTPAKAPAAPVLPPQPSGETLYNGIVLPLIWPPKGEYQPDEPMPVPYLSNPPPVIDITLGRQLFVDNFLIESNTTKRTWHSATLYSNNPVLKPDQAWETTGQAPMAMPFSDGVWLDPMNWVTPPEFKASEVQDVASLIERFKPGTNALANFLATSLSAGTQGKFKEFKGVDVPAIEAMKKILADELNPVIAGPLIFEAQRFEGVKLSDRAGALLAQNPQGSKLKRLNRWLLEDAFPRELFRMQPVFTCHYMAGYGRGTAMAISTNGLDWEKPEFDVQPGSNLVQLDPRDSSTVWFSPEDPDPKRRYKMWRSHSEDGRFGLSLHYSDDGIHWGPRALRTGSNGDRSTVFWNPFRRVWVYSLRHGWGEPRARRYWEVRDLIAGPHWSQISEPPMWVGSDRLDPMRDDLQVKPQLYNLDATPYESLMVGLFTIWRGDKNIPAGRPKPNSIWLGFSRDGYHWDRPDRRPLIDVSEKPGDWNWGNVQSAGGGFLVNGRNLWFYFSGRGGAADKRDAGGAMGLAFLRRDGFCSMDAGPEGAVLTTRPVKFNARFMFVNMKTNAPDGSLRIEILHPDGRPITVTKNDTKEQMQPFTLDKSNALNGDQTLMGVNWQNGIQDLSMLAGRTVRIRFHLKNASLYSFWVGPGQLGRSMGYVAAGGPHFSGPTDTVGNKSYGAFPAVPRTVPPPTPPPAPVPPAPTPALSPAQK